MTYSLPEPLIAPAETGVWGISPESLLLGALSHERDGTVDSQALRRYYDLEILRTNYDPGWDSFEQGIELLCSEWLSPVISRAASIIPPDSVPAFIAGAAYFDTPSGIANLLVQGQQAIESADGDAPVTMSRRDLHGYVDASEERELAKSLRIIKPVADGYRLNRSILEPLAEGFSQSRSEAAYATTRRLMSHLGIEQHQSVIPSILKIFDLQPPASPPAEVTGALSVFIQNNALQDLVDALFGADLETVVAELESQTERERAQLHETLVMTATADVITEPVNWPFEPTVAGVCALASQRDVPLAAGWVAAQTGQSELGVYDDLERADIQATYDDGIIRFNKAYPIPEDVSPAVDEYTAWVKNRLEELQNRLTALRVMKSGAVNSYAQQESRILSDVLSFMESFTISPTRFIYTIFDPEFHADSYNIENYTGNSRELEEEVRSIRRWRKERPYDAESFAEMIPEVINHPLEVDDVDPVVRIMCPWTNFAIQDYVSQLSRLFDNDIEVRLLFRFPERREWSQLKQNLLSRLGDTGGNLELRSYTRYKEYHDHTELRELQEDDESYLKKTGVHAKLFIAGSPQNGNLLAGSANLMENSLYYNPEAGLQTRNPNVLETAIDYFDMVWELAAPDRIPEEAYTEKTQYTSFPAIYRPK